MSKKTDEPTTIKVDDLSADSFPKSEWAQEKERMYEARRAEPSPGEEARRKKMDQHRAMHLNHKRFIHKNLQTGNPEAEEALRRRGLELVWIQRDDFQDYLNRGWVAARREDFDNVEHTLISEGRTGGNVDGLLQRGDAIAMIGPRAWVDDRVNAASELAQAQLDELDYLDPAKGIFNMPGEFGKPSRVAPHLVDALRGRDDEG